MNYKEFFRPTIGKVIIAIIIAIPLLFFPFISSTICYVQSAEGWGGGCRTTHHSLISEFIDIEDPSSSAIFWFFFTLASVYLISCVIFGVVWFFYKKIRKTKLE